MDEAIIALTRKGLFKTSIRARDVRSREDARKLYPLAAPGDILANLSTKRSFARFHGFLVITCHASFIW
jgi:hypothetical protein